MSLPYSNASKRFRHNCKHCRIWTHCFFWSKLFTQTCLSDLGLHCLHRPVCLIWVYTVYPDLSVRVRRLVRGRYRSKEQTTRTDQLISSCWTKEYKILEKSHSNPHKQNITYPLMGAALTIKEPPSWNGKCQKKKQETKVSLMGTNTNDHRLSHCDHHLGKINSHKSIYIKVWRCTFWWITLFSTENLG